MAFNVADFASNLGQYGTLQTNKFEVRIFSRTLGGGFEGDTVSERISRNLNLTEEEKASFITGGRIFTSRIDSVRLPGIAVDTFESRRYGVGPNIRVGTNVRFEPFSISVITDKNYDTYKYFYTWINGVFGFSGKGSQFSPGENRFPSYLTTYKKEYTKEINVDVFENTGQRKARYIFYEAFPVGITDPSLSWRDNNTLLKFDVTFSYTNWEMNNEDNDYQTGINFAIEDGPQ